MALDFEKKQSTLTKLGVIIGFLLSYFLFTTILFVIFVVIKKNQGFHYTHFIGLTLILTLIGFIIRKFLKQ